MNNSNNITKKFDKLCEFSKNSYGNYTIILLGEKIEVISTRIIDELFIDFTKSIGLRIESISLRKDRMYLVDIRDF